jgi:hypothetical protein
MATRVYERGGAIGKNRANGTRPARRASGADGFPGTNRGCHGERGTPGSCLLR